MLETNYSEVDAKDVVAFFVNGYQFKDGKTLHKYEWFYDPNKGVFVFRLLLTKPEEQK